MTPDIVLVQIKDYMRSRMLTDLCVYLRTGSMHSGVVMGYWQEGMGALFPLLFNLMAVDSELSVHSAYDLANLAPFSNLLSFWRLLLYRSSLLFYPLCWYWLLCVNFNFFSVHVFLVSFYIVSRLQFTLEEGRESRTFLRPNRRGWPALGLPVL